MAIRYDFETVFAEAGDVICYEPGAIIQRHLNDYEHWSVKAAIFRETYRPWETSQWKPEAVHLDLMRYNCRPYYKCVGAWARRLKEPTYLESLESPRPVLVPAGLWILVGNQGEPWHVTDDDFRKRYILDAHHEGPTAKSV
jgi:hypothetical protein